jgi:AbiTii
MGIKQDLQKLIELLTEDEIIVSKAITKVKALNKKLNNKKISEFIDGEVNGKYNDDTLPEYRLIWGEPTFEFKNIYNGTTDIRNIALPESKHFNNKSTNYRPVLFSVSEIEEIIEKNKGSTFRMLFTPGQFEVAGNYITHILDENDNWQLTRAWWSHSLTSFPSMLFKIKQQLIDILLDIEHSILEKDYQEKIFSEKSQFDASFEISQLIEKAKNEIILIDGYVDTTTLKLLTSKKNNVSIKILTDPKAKSEALEVLIEKFNKQYKGLEIRYSKSFHDRFIIIDNINFYQIGASMKDLGNKTFSFIKLKEEFMTDALMSKFKLEWK